MAIQDPPEMGMEKRLLLAMVLSMAILFLVPYFTGGPPPLPAPEPAVEVEELGPPAVSRELPQEIPATEEAEPTALVARQIIEVTNQDLVLRFSNAGVVLQSAQLRNYRTTDDRLLEMIPQQLPEPMRQAFGIRTGDEEWDRRLMGAVYEVTGVAGVRVQAPAEITFHYRDSLIEVSRTIRIPAEGYVVDMETDVRVQGRSVPFSVLLGPGIGEVSSTTDQDFADPKAAYFSNGAVQRYTAEEVEEAPAQLAAGARWIALDSKFFTYLLLSPDRIRGGTITHSGFVEETPDGEGLERALLRAEVEMEAGASYSAFLGPKSYQVLQATDPTLNQLIDYGWFAFLVRPLLLSLNFLYRYLGNYGWAIIALTFGINLVLAPVRYKQTASMKKMSVLQPQIKAIQDRYKRMKRTDPRQAKKNEEVMALYKEHGVNPLGGCLPLVIQMPFLFAFYQMLYSSMELRGAPFIGWIQDLSRHDPYYVTPILMGISMVVQQKMTPAAGDPTQRKMMMALPVVFTFFFLNFSSGLVLYFLFSNLFGMMFQFLTQRWQEATAEAPAKKPSKKK
ncbi:MAG: membrane protein insertase YidC [Acidobacteriota bacterium]